MSQNFKVRQGYALALTEQVVGRLGRSFSRLLWVEFSPQRRPGLDGGNQQTPGLGYDTLSGTVSPGGLRL